MQTFQMFFAVIICLFSSCHAKVTVEAVTAAVALYGENGQLTKSQFGDMKNDLNVNNFGSVSFDGVANHGIADLAVQTLSAISASVGGVNPGVSGQYISPKNLFAWCSSNSDNKLSQAIETKYAKDKFKAKEKK